MGRLLYNFRSTRYLYVLELLTHSQQRAGFAIDSICILKSTGCMGCRRSSPGDVSSACSGNWAIRPKRVRPVQRDRSLTPVVTPMSFHCGNPIWETISARRCCVTIFANFLSSLMSSCTFWKTARSDTQTTTRGHPDRTCENIVRPMKRHGASPDEIPFSANMRRMHQRRPRRKSSGPSKRRNYLAPD